ncbi:amidohydrolase family protein [Planctomicrobium sp. SH664]|uniref:amidohydrolase family protein n=1 Tax=Planctomicrobium sp. SH664 TaxID=3448125 RepID=UPI003F5C2F49
MKVPPVEMTRRTLLGAMVTSLAMRPLTGWGADAPRTRSPIIDCHVHLKHGDIAGTEWQAGQIVELLDQTGIDKAIVFAMKTTTARSIEMAAAAVKEYPDRLIPFLYGLPSYEGPVLQQVEQAVTEQGFRGIKIHVGECSLAEYIIDPLLRLAGTFPIPCLIDVSGNSTTAARMARSFPNTPLWFAHMGKYNSTNATQIDEFIRVAKDHDNVWLDLSAVGLPEKIEEAADLLGAERLLWGTDGPYKHPTTVEYVQSEMNKVLKSKLSQSQQDLILGGNVRRLLNMT